MLQIILLKVPAGRRNKWAQSNAISILRWIIREVSLVIFNNPKMMMVADTNPMRTNDAPLVRIVATTLTGGARLGNGLLRIRFKI